MRLSFELGLELSGFWKWFSVGKELYGTGGYTPNKEESMYPRYSTLIKLTLDAIKKLEDDGENEELVSMILEVMGLDNEDEEILDYVGNQINNLTIEYIVENGVVFPFYQTRWQIAELIGRIKNDNLENHLIELLNDSNKYVQRRSLLSMRHINPKLAEQYSLIMLEDEDYMLRLVSLRILIEISSDSLDYAISLLKNEKCKLILDEIEKLKK